MFLNKNITYKDILILMLVVIVGYILLENYNVFFAFLRRLLSILAPFIYALIIAYCLSPLINIFEKKVKLKRGLSILLTYVIIISLLALGVIYVLPNITDSVISITLEVSKYVEIGQEWIENAFKNENLYNLLMRVGAVDYLSELSSKFGTTFIWVLEGSITSIFLVTTNLVKIVLGFVLAIYVLLDKERLLKGTKTLIYMAFKEERSHQLIKWVKTYNRMVGLYIGTKAIDSTIIGVIAFVGLSVIDAPYTGLMALIVGVTNMVPYLGPLVGEIIGAFVGLTVSPTMAITMFLLLFTIQQFDAWYLDPKLVGNKVGVRPIFIILGLILGGRLFGVIGMLLASPTMATIKVFYDEKVAAFKAKNSNLVKYIEK